MTFLVQQKKKPYSGIYLTIRIGKSSRFLRICGGQVAVAGVDFDDDVHKPRDFAEQLAVVIKRLRVTGEKGYSGHHGIWVWPPNVNVANLIIVFGLD